MAEYDLLGAKIYTVISGSTHTITPRRFIDDLKVLDVGGAGSKAAPNGLRDMRGEPKSAQELYDEKYFVKEAAPPEQQHTPHKTNLLGLPIQPSPTNSYQGSVNSQTTPSVKEEKKKKRGLLARFGG